MGNERMSKAVTTVFMCFGDGAGLKHLPFSRSVARNAMKFPEGPRTPSCFAGGAQLAINGVIDFRLQLAKETGRSFVQVFSLQNDPNAGEQ
jgi:hypothetical protein